MCYEYFLSGDPLPYLRNILTSEKRLLWTDKNHPTIAVTLCLRFAARVIVIITIMHTPIQEV
jgi:hypothetical protein